jgi:enterobactin synthetase component D
MELFRPMPVPGIVASAGVSYAVSLLTGPTDGASQDVCELPIPGTLHRAVPSRVRAYLAGRHCATRSLRALYAGLGLPPSPMPDGAGAFGAPRWPTGVVGSITHSATLAIAVVAHRDLVHGIGIDCESIMSADAADEVAGRIVPEENGVPAFSTAAATLARPVFVSTVFSAKESIYKCLNPLTGLFFGFDAVTLEWIDLDAGRMGFRIVGDLGGAAPVGMEMTVRYAVESEHVVTAVSLPAEARR